MWGRKAQNMKEPQDKSQERLLEAHWSGKAVERGEKRGVQNDSGKCSYPRRVVQGET